MRTPELLEAVMLLCFGLAWPLGALRMFRSRRPEGRGLMFTLIILAGYACGVLSKLLAAEADGALAPVFWLYLLNALSVAANATLQWHLSRPGLLAISSKSQP